MRETLTRNLGIHRQIIFLDALFAAAHVPAVLLKGAGLIEAIPELTHTRFMEDIDILVRPADSAAISTLLETAGYWRVPEDPSAWEHDDYPEHLDITDTLWYLDERENSALFVAAKQWQLPGLFAFTHLPPDEFIVHILAHTCIHHGRPTAECNDDRAAISSHWPELTTPERLSATMNGHGLHALAAYASEGRFPGTLSRLCMRSTHPLRGHVLRWLFLPAKKKASHLFRTLFPPAAFIRNRYNCRSTGSVTLYRIIRPGLLVAMLFRVLFRWGKQ